MLMEKQKELLKFEGIFSPRSPLEFVAFCFATILLSQLSDLLKELVPKIIAYAVSGLFVVILFTIWWLIDRSRTRKRAVQLTFKPTKDQPAAARGLILLLSPYDPRNPTLREEKKLQPLLGDIKSKSIEELSDANFEKINLLNSNLRPQIKAVEYHQAKGKLRDIWLVTSQSYDTVKGSEDAAVILEKYLRLKYKDKPEVHREGLSVKEWDYRGLWELGEKIFRESGYKEEVLLADVTGGTKMMSVAMALACIPPGRRMQYVYSERDWQGNPLEKGAIDPVVIIMSKPPAPPGDTQSLTFSGI